MLYSLMYSKTMSAVCRPYWGRAKPALSITIRAAGLVWKLAGIWLVEFDGSMPVTAAESSFTSVATSPLAVIAPAVIPIL